MKIRIHTESCHLRLRIPNRLLCCSFVFKIVEEAVHGHTDMTWTMDKETRAKIQKALKECCRKYRGLQIVDVKTADGQSVEIIL